jgi:hypothetical protein
VLIETLSTRAWLRNNRSQLSRWNTDLGG